MATRSITDQEISLIKGMLEKGMKNTEIQFFFNRPERKVNTGRISQIKGGSYSTSAAIKAADPAVVETFITSFRRKTANSGEDSGPTGEETLRSLFHEVTPGEHFFRLGESDRHECKEDFGFKHSGKWLRAIAALANNTGGYVIFGVKDKNVVNGNVAADSYKVLGMKSPEFENADPVDFTSRLKAVFDPTPKIETALLEFSPGQKVGVIYVHQHPSRPVIALKNEGGDQVRESDIFFRYPGQSSRIKYSDLRAILDDRDRDSRQQILPMVERLLALGPSHAMVADLTDGVLTNGARSLVIGDELLGKINFIQQGQFDEKEGAATLKIVGDVYAVDGEGQVIRRGFVTPVDLIRDFLSADSPYDPKDYIRCAVEAGNGGWFPLHYYAHKSNLNLEALTSLIEGTKAPLKRKQLYVDRVRNHDSAFTKAGGAAPKYRAGLDRGLLPKTPETAKDALTFARAIGSLESQPPIDVKKLLALLKICWDFAEGIGSSEMSVIRKAAARIDQLYFAE
ncbi:putative transcriptional regulator with HTH domain-containing protein [Rhizobium sp. CF122]|uniref:AlbA family DNA-binding domain-containing protein n=1 Tax=Rhizobium sp. CF122 TaxID=1144312 RepID=UPI000271A038|nr:ATP-binding protein [Rhizobium sp. CF122]EJL57989.1 putative transcriptional regulator with HTH domain-containing protein [Rhizobium sp. CF122]